MFIVILSVKDADSKVVDTWRFLPVQPSLVYGYLNLMVTVAPALLTP